MNYCDIQLIRLPKRFLADHEERALPTPAVHRETKTHLWIDRADPELAELISDAEYYADPYGPSTTEGDWPPRPCPVKNAARALLRALDRQGARM